VAVSGLASTPFDTAVGGTQFDETIGGGSDATFWNATNATNFVSVKGYIPEKVWNESCTAATCPTGTSANLFSGSGGVSTRYATPSWQSPTLNIPGLSFPMRALPDVSLSAAGHDGYLVCLNASCQGGSFFLVAGTSASSPAFAGIMAIVDQKTGGRQGLANYVLYSMAKAEAFSSCNSSSRTVPSNPPTSACIFNDVTTGNNSVPGVTGFTAGTGFDLGTGLGSVNAAALVNAWPNQPGGFVGTTTALSTTATTPIVINHGASVPFNVGVTRTSGTATPSGAVSLIASGGSLTGQVGVAATTISGTGATANGAFTGVSNLPGGTTYNLVASYPGDGTFGASSSTAITVTVNPESSTTTLSSFTSFTNNGTPIAGTTINYGGFLDLNTVVKSSANASPPDGFPSGPITLLDNGSSIGNLALNSRAQAELINCNTPTSTTTPCLIVGSHPIQVTYGGDNGFGASTSGVVTITVNKGTPTGSATGPASAAFNAPITVSARINALGPVQPTGTVQFFEGTTSLSAPLTLTVGNPSTASTQVSLSGSGNQSFTAQYSGDSTYNAATVGPTTVAVSQPFTFTAPTISQTITAGGMATFNITLNSVGGFTGAVNFACTGATGGATCAASPNPANLSASTTSIPVTVTVSNTANARLAPHPFKALPWAFAAAVAGLLLIARKERRQALLMMFAVALILGVGSCGGKRTPPGPTIDTLTVTGTSGSATNSVGLTLTINHP
jgi:subtilase family serine protease